MVDRSALGGAHVPAIEWQQILSRMGSRSYVCVLLFAMVTASAATFPKDRPWVPMDLEKLPCVNWGHAAPRGPFAVWTSCEEELGHYAGIILAGSASAARDTAWTEGDRWWYGSEWGDDVTSYVWNSTGDTIYVATGGIYGSGKLFLLDIPRRKMREIPMPATKGGDESRWHIIAADRHHRELLLRQERDGKVDTIRVEVGPK
jgi:hypothetical protein